MSGPQLFRPRPPLAEHIAYFGYWDRRAGDAHRSRALPRGAATVVVDVGGCEQVDFCDAGGRRLAVAPAFIVGPGTASYLTQIAAAQTIVTIHFRPAGAYPLVDVPQSALTDTCVGLDDLWGRAAPRLREQMASAASATARIALLEAFLLNRLRCHERRPDPQVAAVLECVERNPAMRVTEATALTGLSPKRLIGVFRTEVGLAPKAYLRVRRLQAALRTLDGDANGAAIAAALGYCDQAHFVREFRSLTTMTPTQYARQRSWLPGHADLAAASR